MKNKLKIGQRLQKELSKTILTEPWGDYGGPLDNDGLGMPFPISFRWLKELFPNSKSKKS